MVDFDPPPKTRLYLPLLISIIVFPLLVLATLSARRYISRASISSGPATVAINPGQITATPGTQPISLSALAYDSAGQPIFTGIIYEWGISSTDSIGQLQPNANLATFYPQNEGLGDIWARAVSPAGIAVGSIKVRVCGNTVTCLPASSPTPSTNRNPIITTTGLPAAAIGQFYKNTVSGLDYDLSDTLNMFFSGLPTGLSKSVCTSYLSPDTDYQKLVCFIEGTTYQSGSFPITVTLTDSRGGKTESVLTLRVDSQTTPTPLPSTPTPYLPTPTPAPVPCQVTTSPTALGLPVGGIGSVSAAVTSGQGTATITSMSFGSYYTAVATVSPTLDTVSPYSTSVTAVASGTTSVWATAKLSDGRTCQTTGTTDTDIGVFGSTPTPSPVPSPYATPTPLPPTPTPIPQPITSYLLPTADTYVTRRRPNANYGSASILKIDGSPIEASYLKFDLSPLTFSKIISTKLRFRVSNSSISAQSIKKVLDTSWSETSLTYQNRPALTETLGSIPSPSLSGTWREVDVAPSLAPSLILSLGIESTGSDGLDFSSKDSSYPPQLIVTYLP